MRESLNAIFEAHAAEFSGVCLIKTDADILLSAAGGLANRDFDVPNRIDTRFDTASVTKTFTAAAVLLLAAHGLLRLTDKIHEIIDLHGTTIPEDVTVEQLLTHTSGIADDAEEEAGESYSALFIDKPNYSLRTCADFLPQFAFKPPNFKAGTNVMYNNCAFILLGLAIERLSGMDYRSFVTERIFKASGMENTYFGAKDEICPGTAEGYFAVRDEHGGFIRWSKTYIPFLPSEQRTAAR